MFSRLLTADYQLDGVTLPAGQRVVVLFASANRDERKWAAPEQFDVRRKPSDHVAFGWGEHQCMGMSLARLEMRVAGLAGAVIVLLLVLAAPFARTPLPPAPAFVGAYAAWFGLAETVIAILLFALKRPSYPVDRATFRVLVRHAWLDPNALYDEARDLLVSQAVESGDVPDGLAANRLIDIARGMGQLGRRFCRAAGPRCDQCPLEPVLPEGGPREVDG